MAGTQVSKDSSRWSLRLGRIAGIEVRVHTTFLLLLAWVALGEIFAGHGLPAAVGGVALIVCVFGIIVLHELAHSLVARRFGVRTRDITLLPIGGVSSLERIPDKPRQELAIALAGPSVNIVLALALFGVVAVVASSFLTKLAWINVGLAVFNLLPAFPMDGGRVLRAALALRMNYDRATHVAARLGQAVAVLFGVLGLFFNPVLLFIALFVWIGAQHEAELVHVRSALSGIPVERAMITHFLTLSPGDPLSKALQLTLAGLQTDFPVVDGYRLVGVLTRDAVLRAIASVGGDTPVEKVMRRDFDVVASSDPADAVLAKLDAAEGHAVVVTDHGTVVGMLTPDSVAQLMRVNRALGARPN